MANSHIGEMMRHIKYVVYQEGKYFVSRCLNVEVASFGETVDEAIANLKEAIELYLEDETAEFIPVGDALIGEALMHV